MKKRITITVPEGQNNLSSIIGSYKILKAACAYRKERGFRERYSIELAGLSEQVEFHHGLFSVKPHTHIARIRKTDLIIIPAINQDYRLAVQKNQLLVEWVKRQYQNGAEVASICTGAFLLAASGLLDGKTCSTHWAFAEAFRATYPQVKLQPDQLITDENGIYTNGGAFSFLNLILYLIEKYMDRETAVFCSKVFQIESDRTSQSPFIIFNQQKAHDDAVIRKAQDYIEQHIDEKISMDRLALQLGISRRNFDRRFLRSTGNTPAEYLQRVRVEVAKKNLEQNTASITEIMFDCGYSDPKAFRDIFKRYTGMTPVEYRKRYARRLFA